MQNQQQSLQQSLIGVGNAFKNLTFAAARKIIDIYHNNSQTIHMIPQKTKHFVVQNKDVVIATSIFIILSLAKKRQKKEAKKQEQIHNQQNNQNKQPSQGQKERNNTVEDLLEKLQQNTAQTADKNVQLQNYDSIKSKNKNVLRQRNRLNKNIYQEVISSQEQSEDQRDKIFFQVYKNYYRT